MMPIVNDPSLGSMEHDGLYYNGTTTVAGRSIEFSIGTYQVDDVPSHVDRARQIAQSLTSVLERAKQFAAEKLLSLKNKSWKDDEGRQIDTREFVSRLTVESVTLDGDGVFVIYFNGGGLFFDHHILVTQLPTGELDRAEVHG